MMVSTARKLFRTLPAPKRPSLSDRLVTLTNRLERMKGEPRTSELLARADQCRHGLDMSVRLGFDDELCEMLEAKINGLEDECFRLFQEDPVSVVFFRR